MNLEEAKTLLDSSTRSELRDHAFGDAEVSWTKDGREIADGYFGGGVYEVSMSYEVAGGNIVTFRNEEALELRECGTVGTLERNDETGPDAYAEGVTMPGLTLEGVRQELTKEDNA